MNVMSNEGKLWYRISARNCGDIGLLVGDTPTGQER